MRVGAGYREAVHPLEYVCRQCRVGRRINTFSRAICVSTSPSLLGALATSSTRDARLLPLSTRRATRPSILLPKHRRSYSSGWDGWGIDSGEWGSKKRNAAAPPTRNQAPALRGLTSVRGHAPIPGPPPARPQRRLGSGTVARSNPGDFSQWLASASPPTRTTPPSSPTFGAGNRFAGSNFANDLLAAQQGAIFPRTLGTSNQASNRSGPLSSTASDLRSSNAIKPGGLTMGTAGLFSDKFDQIFSPQPKQFSAPGLFQSGEGGPIATRQNLGGRTLEASAVPRSTDAFDAFAKQFVDPRKASAGKAPAARMAARSTDPFQAFGKRFVDPRKVLPIRQATVGQPTYPSQSGQTTQFLQSSQSNAESLWDARPDSPSRPPYPTSSRPSFSWRQYNQQQQHAAPFSGNDLRARRWGASPRQDEMPRSRDRFQFPPTYRSGTSSAQSTSTSNSLDASWSPSAPDMWSDPTDGHWSQRRSEAVERRQEKYLRKIGPKKARGRWRDSVFTSVQRVDSDRDSHHDDFHEERARLKAIDLYRSRHGAGSEPAVKKTQMVLPEVILVNDLARSLSLNSPDLVNALRNFGFEGLEATSFLTGETAALVAQEFGFEAVVDQGEGRDLKPAPLAADASLLSPRPPVVTIMGHVDHGKTTMLDWLRKSSVAAQEHGGITQHIGAFVVKMSTGQPICFLDTPGHAAFLAMRQRGAIVTDIVVLVVAADDGVMPQTLEALNHIRSAKVPFIVALNKADRPDVPVAHLKSELARHGIEIEDYGGDVPVVCTSGKTGLGMAELEETILTVAEVLDVRAETEGPVEGWILESSVKLHGKSAIVLVKRGTMRVGDIVVAGTSWARIRIMRNDAGELVDQVSPGCPAEVLGWHESLPQAGDQMLQAPDESKAHSVISYRKETADREKDIAESTRLEKLRREHAMARALAKEEGAAPVPWHSGKDPRQRDVELTETTGAATTKLVDFIIKADVVGSAEAVENYLAAMGNDEVRARILRSSAGPITEWDVEHAQISGSVIVNFNQAVSPQTRTLAARADVRIIEQSIIYHVAEEVKQLLSSYLPDKITFKVTGEAEVLQIFNINIKGRKFRNIAGCRIRNGKCMVGSTARVVRFGVTIHEGKIDGMRHHKKEVKEMARPSECGISIDDYDDFMVTDVIQTVAEVREKRTL